MGGKIGIAGVLQNPSVSLNHHNGGWTHLILDQLRYRGYDPEVITEKDNWNKYYKILFLHGVNYKYGVYNLFGGVSDQLIDRFDKIIHYSNNGEMETMFKKFPDLNELCDKRNIDGFYFGDIQEMPIFEMPKSENWTIGDSHSISVCPAYSNIKRMDGKTLHGITQIGLDYIVPEGTKNLILYFGNIDIRFHVVRLGKSYLGIKKLLASMIAEYNDQIQQLIEEHGVEYVTLVHALPIEDESRKIPKTGQYKGENFYGTWAQRNDARLLFNGMIDIICDRFNYSKITWPEHFYNEKGQLSFDVMESRQSVHLRPKYYATRNFGN